MMIKFPSIEHFRKVVKEVVTSSQPNNIPTLSFTGTVKLHGVNVGVTFDIDEHQKITKMTTQSRNNELSIEKDHYGFCAFTQQPLTLEFLKETANKIIQESSKPVDKIVVFGEFCGKSIQSKVAIQELDRMFIVFDILIVYQDGSQNYQPEFMSLFENSEIRVFNINMFKTWHLDIDFNNPEETQTKLIELTEQVEKECPVAKHFGVLGIGEGVVWRSDKLYNNKVLRFKVKGELHSVTKADKIANIDIEQLNNVKEFVDYAITESRLEQGLEYLREQGLYDGYHIETKDMPVFLKWLAMDVFKEEKDTIIKNNLDEKLIRKQISIVGNKWIKNYL